MINLRAATWVGTLLERVQSLGTPWRRHLSGEQRNCWGRDLAVRHGADTVHGAVFEVHEHLGGHKSTAGGLIVVELELEVGGAQHIPSLRIWSQSDYRTPPPEI